MSFPATTLSADELQKAARDHLWLHFTRMSGYADGDVRCTELAVTKSHDRWEKAAVRQREKDVIAPDDGGVGGEKQQDRSRANH